MKTRLIRLRDRGENVVTFEVNATIDEIKNYIREVAKERGLGEKKQFETENFMVVRAL